MVVDDDRSSGERSGGWWRFGKFSHMEWQILLATGMPTVTSSRFQLYRSSMWIVEICFFNYVYFSEFLLQNQYLTLKIRIFDLVNNVF